MPGKREGPVGDSDTVIKDVIPRGKECSSGLPFDAATGPHTELVEDRDLELVELAGTAAHLWLGAWRNRPGPQGLHDLLEVSARGSQLGPPS